MTKYWYTLDGRKIPIKYMTTTHIGNSLHMLSVTGNTRFKPDLLEEWTLREKEGIFRKARRFIGRIAGRYYSAKSKKKKIYDGLSNIDVDNEFDYC